MLFRSTGSWGSGGRYVDGGRGSGYGECGSVGTATGISYGNSIASRGEVGNILSSGPIAPYICIGSGTSSCIDQDRAIGSCTGSRSSGSCYVDGSRSGGYSICGGSSTASGISYGNRIACCSQCRSGLRGSAVAPDVGIRSGATGDAKSDGAIGSRTGCRRGSGGYH